MFDRSLVSPKKTTICYLPVSDPWELSPRAHGEPEKSQAWGFPGSNAVRLEQVPEVTGRVEDSEETGLGASVSFDIALLCDLGQAPSHSGPV